MKQEKGLFLKPIPVVLNVVGGHGRIGHLKKSN